MNSDFVPALDDLSGADSEGKRLVAAVAGVEGSAIDKSSVIMHLDLVSLPGFGSFFTLSKDLNGVLFDEIFSEEGSGEDEEKSNDDQGLHL